MRPLHFHSTGLRDIEIRTLFLRTFLRIRTKLFRGQCHRRRRPVSKIHATTNKKATFPTGDSILLSFSDLFPSRMERSQGSCRCSRLRQCPEQLRRGPWGLWASLSHHPFRDVEINLNSFFVSISHHT